MGIETHIDPETGLRAHVVTGPLSIGPLIDTLEQVYRRPDFDPSHHVLWDLRASELAAFTSADIERTATHVAARWTPAPGTRAALVVARDLDYGLSRMYEQILAASWTGELRVFRGRDAAERWLFETPSAP